MRRGDVTADVPPARCDVLVVGSGAGGLSAAVTAASLGLNVIVVEKEAVFGGTTAWSGGWLWIPRNPLAVAAGIVEDAEAPRTYLRHELGPHYDETRVEAFLEQGPADDRLLPARNGGHVHRRQRDPRFPRRKSRCA
jgi:succinate dehydrogenase/fumarate reductase flavoprotein subunit